MFNGFTSLPTPTTARVYVNLPKGSSIMDRSKLISAGRRRNAAGTPVGRQAPPLRRQHHQVDRGEDHQQQQVEALENQRRIIYHKSSIIVININNSN